MSLSYTPKAFVGRPAPDFTMPSTKNINTLEENVSLSDYAGKWLVLLFYPLDFTFVCPTELRGFSDRADDFRKEGAEIVGVSIDSVHTHRAWIKASRDNGGLGELRYPLASDLTHAVSKDYGVFIEESGHSLRGTFLIDPKGVLRLALVNDLDVGRSVDETLRAIQAFKTGGLCPVDWRPGQATLTP
ncbi:MAG: Alkyl hydroperoxide reductase subunit C-like protein [Labilithrix sp.]|nr:Alkyl hydroperoxide reductase subunit C-like protein [Labilithrix sp.]